jgi:hypothetical protein
MIAEYEGKCHTKHLGAQQEPPLEKGILETFEMLGIQSVMYNNSQTSDYHLQQLHTRPPPLGNLPEQFTDPIEARRLLVLIIIGSQHW